MKTKEIWYLKEGAQQFAFGKKHGMEHKEFFTEHGENKTVNVSTLDTNLPVHPGESENIFKVQ